MRAPSAFVVVAVGLLLLWLAVAGRLEAVWSALTAGGAVGGAGGGGGMSGGLGGGGDGGNVGPILNVRLPDYMEYLYPGRDRFMPDGSGAYRKIPGGEWSKYTVPVTP